MSTPGVSAALAKGIANMSIGSDQASQARRRLSVAGSKDIAKIDGATDDRRDHDSDETSSSSSSADSSARSAASNNSTSAKKSVFSHHASLSKVGYVPFNPNKVNQDRAIKVVNVNGSAERAIFGVLDGHGALGHEVSQFLSTELPAFIAKQPNLDSQPHEAITKAFLDCNTKLASGPFDCTFSGSTAIVCYLHGTKLYSCNAGDSRAVLSRVQTGPNGDVKYVAIPLSSDQKPERADEKKRILESKGRVEACKGLKGEDIGPARVWLLHQDVPGLAMTRSFGDLIAASVGVIAKPEVWERDLTEQDRFMILASDGVWEFISNQEAVDIVVGAHAKNNPNINVSGVNALATQQGCEEAAKALVEEAVRRWHSEEEVVDDITAVIVYF